MGSIDRSLVDSITDRTILDFMGDYEVPFDFCGTSLPSTVVDLQNRVIRGEIPLCQLRQGIYKCLEDCLCEINTK